MGVIEVLQLIFVVLKLCGVIDWSWWAVFIPLFVDIALYTIVIILTVISQAGYKRALNKWKKGLDK